VSDERSERHTDRERNQDIAARAADRSPLALDSAEASLLDVVDNLLNRGVVLDAELVLGLAGVDLIYAHLNALVCAADRVLPREDRRSG
jgi:hypothetical protein